MVRKTLGQHDIPTLQTIGIDHAAGMVKLSTTLARLGEGESLRIGQAPRRGNRVGLHLSSGCWRCLRYNRQRWQLL
jgi:hypothetical protein